MSEQAKLLAAEYASNIANKCSNFLDTDELNDLQTYLEIAYEAGWKACERKDLPYDAMTEGQ